MPRKLAPDIWLFGVAVVLLSAGVVMVYSASAIVAADRFHDPYFFLKKQIFWALLGAACLWMAIRVDYRRLETFVLPLLIFAGILLVLVLVSPFGQAINGTRRWIRRGPVPPLAIAGVLALLVLAQPDLGNCLTLITLTFTLLFLAGGHARHLGFILLAALPPLVVAIWMAPYRLRRIFAFIDPWSDPRGSGFQIIQSWLAFGNGGIFGQGIGASRQKLFYLPESHTDFIFAIVGEELGLVGALTIVALFVVLIWRGLRIGLREPDPFGGYLALGITVLIATQTLVNLGVVTGLLPTKGLPLPFISFGGSALLVTMLSTGVLLNISQQAHASALP